jgi:hypothetical protein
MATTTNAYNMQTTPLPPHSGKTPEILALLRSYWENISWQDPPELLDSRLRENGSYYQFYREHDLISYTGPAYTEMISKLVHPIFRKSNWMSGHKSVVFDQWYNQVQPALRLASMFIEDPHMLRWWTHLRDGEAGFQSDWVGIKPSAKESSPGVLQDIRNELRNVDRRVKFTFLAGKDLHRHALGCCFSSMVGLTTVSEESATKNGRGCPGGFWYNP